jgi:hypothetical protein
MFEVDSTHVKLLLKMAGCLRQVPKDLKLYETIVELVAAELSVTLIISHAGAIPQYATCQNHPVLRSVSVSTQGAALATDSFTEPI